MSLTPSAIRSAIVAALAADYPALTVEAHGGQFTERELPLLLAKAPALLVSCVGLGKVEGSTRGRWRIPLSWALYVLGADAATTERDVLALDTATSVLTALPDQRWGLPDARLPELDSLRAENLYTGHVNTLRIAMWVVTWTQSFLL